MKHPGWVWMDGELRSARVATVSVASHALHYGSSVFEGIRVYATPSGPAVLGLREHLRRFLRSAHVFKLQIPYDEEQLAFAVIATLAANELDAAYVRPIAFRGAGSFHLDGRRHPVHVSVLAFPWGEYLGEDTIEQGVDVVITSWRRPAPGSYPLLAKVGGNYVASQLIAMEARDRGAHEGIALDANGMVSEGSGENVFAVVDGTVYTPPVSCSILDGITRRFVMQLLAELGEPVREAAIPREMLEVADEIFLTGTAAEITPVRSLDGRPVSGGRRGPLTTRLQRAFYAIVQGDVPDRFGWLSPAGRPRLMRVAGAVEAYG
ncbi:MAG TPA: branched-chain amino acid transaminase [Thermoanaerobaculia bacterium]|jgi:branched-chain amino acid aminotransferase|nr:branched-chain amino acid transaminase [Thermoanaerobaculia bacterium]